MANIFYLGDNTSGSTSGHRARAIERLGHTVFAKDPFRAFSTDIYSRWLGRFHFHTGYRFLQGKLAKWLAAELSNDGVKPDLIWVDNGELFGPPCLRVLKKMNCPVLLYSVDDPTGKRDGRRFASLIRAISLYDHAAVVRKESEIECKKLGVKHVMLVYRSYDEVAHLPVDKSEDIPPEFRSDVAFLGTWMRYEKRDEFLLQLIEQGVPVSFWGDHWEKSPNYERIKSYWRGPTLRGRDYVAALQGAKICLGLLSKGNRDLHTTRSLETPFAGGLLCAQRTTEHQDMYKEGVEAVFWSDASECARVCKQLLENDALRESIREAGMRRVRSLHVGNEDICNKILTACGVARVGSEMLNHLRPEQA